MSNYLSLPGVHWRFFTRRLFLIAAVWSLGVWITIGANWSTWLNQAPGSAQWSAVPAIDANNSVFISSSQGTVLALDGKTGKEIWRRTIGEAASKELLVANDSVVVVGARTGKESVLFGLDPANGRTRWRHRLGGTALIVPGAATPDAFVFASTVDTVIAVRATDGSLVWSTSLIGALGARPVEIDGASMAVGHGLVVVSDHFNGPWGPNTLLALDFDTGGLRWTLPKVSSAGAVPLSNGHFLVGRKLNWNCGPDGYVSISPNGEIIDHLRGIDWSNCNGVETAFSVLSDFLFLAGSGRHGFLQWVDGRPFVSEVRVAGIGFSRGQPTVTADGTVHDIRAVGEPDGKLANWLSAFASSEWAGPPPQVLGQTKIAGNPSVPVVTPSGMIVVVSPDIGYVIGEEGTAPLALTHWPKARGDRANSACEPSFNLGAPRGDWQFPGGNHPSDEPLSLTTTLRGARPIKVEWYRNAELLGETASGQWRVPSPSAGDTGDYRFVAENSHGSFTSSPVHVEIDFGMMVKVEGGGSVQKNVPSTRFLYGTRIRLEAIPQSDAKFLGWSGDLTGDDPIQEFAITRDLQIVARFTRVPRSLKYALDLGELDTRVDGVPAVGLDGVVYHTHGRRLFALTPRTGEVLWKFEDPSILESPTGIFPIVLNDGSILLPAARELLCVDGESHHVKWRVATSGRVWVGELGGIMEYLEPSGRPESGILRIRDPQTGTLLWEGTGPALLKPPEALIPLSEFLRNRTPGNTPAVGSIFVGWESTGVMGGWNAETGTLSWLAPPINAPGTLPQPIIGQENFIYALTTSSRLYALSERDGHFRWVKQLGAQVLTQPTLAQDRTLYLTVGSEVVGLDSVNGGTLWSYAFKDAFGQPFTKPRTAPAIGDDGIAYVGTEHGLVAIEVGSSLADTPWPKVHGNPQNSGRSKRHAPILYEQAKGQTLVNHGTGSLRVGVSGNPAPEFQWYLDGRPILNATNSEVDLSKTGVANGGALTVVARNGLGSTESRPIYLFGENQVPIQVMGLKLNSPALSSVRIERSTSFGGPWIFTDTVDEFVGSHLWSDLEPMVSGAQFYRCMASTPIQVLAAPLNALRIEAPSGSSRSIEFVDATSGWAHWQRLTNVTVQTSPVWILDPTLNPPKPRYYRIVNN